MGNNNSATHLRIGTRGSALALRQSEIVRQRLAAASPGIQISLATVTTKGDRAHEAHVAAAGTTGLFTREIEEALLAKRVDLAVHSLKDLPTAIPEGLLLAAYPEREDPADALVAKGGLKLNDLPQGATVLSGSPRRRAQLLRLRPDLVILPVRGNVPTRLRKLDESDAHAIVLACAGLTRLGLTGRIAERFNPQDFPPACGQGILTVEARAADSGTLDLCRLIDDGEVRLAAVAERAFLSVLGCGCRTPVGVYARAGDIQGTMVVGGTVSSINGSMAISATLKAAVADEEGAADLGQSLAEDLLAQGAKALIGEAELDQTSHSGIWE